MDGELERDIRAFLQSLANECCGCLRRNQGYCETCYASRAKHILERMARPHPFDNPALRCDIVARMARIAAILKRAERPMLSVEIDMRDYCSRSLKEFTLREMIRHGKIVRRRIRGTDKYLYSLKSTTQPTKGTNQK